MSTGTEAFRRVMSDAGLTYNGEIYTDGKLHRFKANGDSGRNSWFVFRLGSPAAGAFGCWKRDIKQTWCATGVCRKQSCNVCVSNGRKPTLS